MAMIAKYVQRKNELLLLLQLTTAAVQCRITHEVNINWNWFPNSFALKSRSKIIFIKTISCDYEKKNLELITTLC